MDLNTMSEADNSEWLRNQERVQEIMRSFKPTPTKLVDRPQPARVVKSEQPTTVIAVRDGNDCKFQPGVSGNPAGRPNGSKNRNSNQLKQRLMENVEGILDAMVEQALAGDAQAAALVVNRVLPTLRPQSELVQFTLHVDQPISKQCEQVLLAVSRGEVAADVGSKIVQVIQSLANIRAVEDLSKRIEALEAKEI